MPQVWIVDDEEAVRDSLTILLECNGLTACSFASGEAMLTAVHACHGCLLLDIAMPEMDGFAVMAALHERDSQVPVIVMTGHGDALMERRVLAAKAHAMLNKPIAEDILLEAVRAALADAEAQG